MRISALTHRRVRANGIELHCAESGDAGAPLLILLHGFPECWFAWRDYMPPPAASGFHVVAPGQRDYGQNDKPVASTPTDSTRSPTKARSPAIASP